MIGETFFRRDLPGGARLVGEIVPGRRSAALGIWFRVGSRDETPGREGMAHFIEHLVFKGTERRSGREIAASLERVGGALEAFTTKETTCFYARVLDEHLDLAVDVLTDLVSRPRFDPGDVEMERDVVLEELRSVEDAPEDLIGDLTHAHLWPGDILGAPILGTRESLSALDAERVRNFHREEYVPSRVVVSAAGSVDPDRLAALLAERLELGGTDPESRRQPPSPAVSTLSLYPSDLSQVYLALAIAAPSEVDPRRRAAHLLTELFGGGMSSRLFQTIREDAGLAYSVYSYTEHFDDVGLFGTSLGTSPARGTEALERTLEEMDLLRREGLRAGELDAAKAQVRGSIIMGMESLTQRMTRLARVELRTGESEDVEKVLAEYDAVGESEVMDAAETLLDPARQNLVALGPVNRGHFAFHPFSRVEELEVP